MSSSNTRPSTAAVVLKASELPACCPNPKMPIWNQHPKVFLDITHEGSAKCPYCGTVYELESGAVVHGH